MSRIIPYTKASHPKPSKVVQVANDHLTCDINTKTVKPSPPVVWKTQ